MNITVNEELLAYIDPLTPEEHSALERSLLAEGCRDALVLWGEVLVDGHSLAIAAMAFAASTAFPSIPCRTAGSNPSTMSTCG